MTKNTATFEQYLEAVDDVFRADAGFEISFTGQTGHDCWREKYEGGLSAREAAEEEMSHWEDDA